MNVSPETPLLFFKYFQKVITFLIIFSYQQKLKMKTVKNSRWLFLLPKLIFGVPTLPFTGGIKSFLHTEREHGQ